MSIADSSPNFAPLWTPSPERIARSNMTAFMHFVTERHGCNVDGYDALWRWSVDRRADFWSCVWEFCGVISSASPDAVLEDGDAMPGARWFRGARLNFAENLLARGTGLATCSRFSEDANRADLEVCSTPAVIFWNEQGPQRSLSTDELTREVARIAAWLRQANVRPGDRVAAMTPNIPETLIMMLAAASVGATFASCSAEFGADAVVERFGQIEPVVLLAVDGYRYRGKAFEVLDRVAEVTSRIASIRHSLVVPYLHDEPNISNIASAARWNDIPETGEPLSFEQLPFDHPLYVLFSSGTTGPPKCIVHSAGGTLLQHLKEHVLHTNLLSGDRLFYFTTCSWMMWNWLVSGLASGATVVLYDGAPFEREGNILLDLAQQERLHVFGVGASYIAAIQKQGLRPHQTHDLAALETILSTGSPLAPESFDYVYRDVKADVCLSSISGGTDIVSCFALGNPNLPVYRGELQCRGLGMRVEVFDDDGRAVVGEKGELVCTAPFPSMPLGFWNDDDGSRYREAYFARFPGVWTHGDYCELTPRGTLIIHGRSDAVLNPGGVRIGTAEIYRQVQQVPEVLESVAIGQTWRGEVRVILFVRLREAITLDDTLVARIKQQIRAGASPRHVPAKILQVADIPRTQSGKLVELAVGQTVAGQPAKNLRALANPEALDHFRDRPELQE